MGGRGQSEGGQGHAHTFALSPVQQTRFSQLQQEGLVLAEVSVVNNADLKVFTATTVRALALAGQLASNMCVGVCEIRACW